MYRKPETTSFYRRKLPHWEVHDGVYFVTIHTRGAIPEAGRRRLLALKTQYEAAVGDNEALRLRRLVFRELEVWLEQAPTSRDLAVPAVAEAVVEAIERRQRRGDWRMAAFAVMPNHVHLFFHTPRRLTPLLREFKRWTGQAACQRLGRIERRFWQREWFDHWSRSPAEDEKIKRYIAQNPVKAGLTQRPEDWPYSSAARPPA